MTRTTGRTGSVPVQHLARRRKLRARASLIISVASAAAYYAGGPAAVAFSRTGPQSQPVTVAFPNPELDASVKLMRTVTLDSLRGTVTAACKWHRQAMPSVTDGHSHGRPGH